MICIAKIQSLLPPSLRRFLELAVCVLFCFLGDPLLAAQSAGIALPAYGPWNAVVLPDGPGLTKPVASPSNYDSPTASQLERPLANRDAQSQSSDPILRGRAAWTIVFWFRADELLEGTSLLAGMGDSSAEDARYVALHGNRLALWLGRGAVSSVLVESSEPLTGAGWHMAAASSNGDAVTLFSDGSPVGSAALNQGQIAAIAQIAPSPLAQPGSRHFGGRVSSFEIYREALSAEAIAAMAAVPPSFEVPTYEEASPRWPVETSAQAGYSAPQDPSTLPRGVAPFGKPVAKPLRATDLKAELKGTNPWRIEGGWKLIAAPQVNASGEDISNVGFAADTWYAAIVPGTVLTTLIDRGVYPDPDYGLNNMAIPESLAHQEYWYRVEFRAPPKAHGRRNILTFEGVNYAAEVWLNGKKLGGITGAFVRGRFDVTNFLAAQGMNALAVRVSPPPHPGIAHEQSIKAGPGENGGIQLLDGPTFSATEGWDWIPGIRDRDTGIWQDVTLTATGTLEVGDPNVVTTLPKSDRSEADVEIEAPVRNTSAVAVEGEVTATFDDVKISRHMRLEPGETVVRLTPNEFPQLKIAHPRLWWPNGYGEPALHALTVSVKTADNTSSERRINFGMREVSYETSLMDSTGHLRRMEVLPARTHDEATALIDESHKGIRQIVDRTPNQFPPGQPVSASVRHAWVHSLVPGAEASPSIVPVKDKWFGTDLVIKVNGERIAVRGGNWGMDDSRKRVLAERLEPYFRLHRDAHVNMIRNWMGQNTEESFYALADKFGLMVWNDFWESTQNYNVEAQDPQLFLANAHDTIVRFRHHPSIVVWCGRNEGVPQPIVNEGLASLVRTLDHTRYYTGNSNQVNLRGSGPYQYQPLESFYRINRGFSVELGIPSVPTLESIESFIPKPDRWPISDTWAYHDWHQNGNGAVGPFMQHMETSFGAATSLEDFERKAQMLDYTAYRAIFEGFAAHLWEPNSGRIIWMTQPAWPSMEWNFLSSDYDTQSSFFGTQKACEPVHAQLNLADSSVDLINLGESHSFKVRTLVEGLDGSTLSDHTNQILAAPNARTPVGKLDLEKLAADHTVLVELAVSDDRGTPFSTNFYWWSKNEASLRELNNLEQAAIEAEATVATLNGERVMTVRLKNTGRVPSLLTKITLKDAGSGLRILPAYYSENYISLLHGEESTVTVSFPAGPDQPALSLRGWNLPTTAVAVR